MTPKGKRIIRLSCVQTWSKTDGAVSSKVLQNVNDYQIKEIYIDKSKAFKKTTTII